MAHKNKIRGNNLEREIVNSAKEVGLSAKRAYASDGRSLGKSEVVDVLVEEFNPQTQEIKGRCSRFAPEVDGEVLLRTNLDEKTITKGMFVPGLITGVNLYDLTGELVGVGEMVDEVRRKN